MKLRRRFAVSLTLILISAAPLFPEIPAREEIDSWLAAGDTYSREEVIQIVENLIRIGLEEIETTSREAVREAVAEEAGKTAYYRDLAERERLRLRELEAECVRLRRRCWILGGLGAGFGVTAGGLYLSHQF